jgi:hypothetical protein
MPYLPFISDNDLKREIWRVINVIYHANADAEAKFYRNVVDPFSAVFDSLCQDITIESWVKQEKSRQIQKTLQNALGDFHQEILGAITGWRSMGRGHVFDIINEEQKIIAEVKNKYNTTKGNHKVAIYDDLRDQIRRSYRGYTSYYVEVIPNKRKTYDKPFTPSDNRTHRRRPVNNKIRVIDGKSFYALATGDPESLKKLFESIPAVMADITDKPLEKINKKDVLMELFRRAY